MSSQLVLQSGSQFSLIKHISAFRKKNKSGGGNKLVYHIQGGSAYVCCVLVGPLVQVCAIPDLHVTN